MCVKGKTLEPKTTPQVRWRRRQHRSNVCVSLREGEMRRNLFLAPWRLPCEQACNLGKRKSSILRQCRDALNFRRPDSGHSVGFDTICLLTKRALNLKLDRPCLSSPGAVTNNLTSQNIRDPPPLILPFDKQDYHECVCMNVLLFLSADCRSRCKAQPVYGTRKEGAPLLLPFHFFIAPQRESSPIASSSSSPFGLTCAEAARSRRDAITFYKRVFCHRDVEGCGQEQVVQILCPETGHNN